jgi:hypothetical protein
LVVFSVWGLVLCELIGAEIGFVGSFSMGDRLYILKKAEH